MLRATELETLFDVEVRVVRNDPGDGTPGLRPAEARVVARAAPARRAEFAAGRACAHAALAALGAPDIPLLPGADRAPLWPDGFVGSITHARGACAAVAACQAATAGLGIDVEPQGALAPALRPLVCRPEELDHHAALVSGGPDWAMLAFCAKEAFYKAFRPLTGRFLDFHDVAVRFIPWGGVGEGAFEVSPAGPVRPSWAAAPNGRWRREAGHLWAAFAWPAQTVRCAMQ